MNVKNPDPTLDEMRYARGNEDGEKGRPPTELTPEYLDGYYAGRQLRLDRTPPEW